MYKTKGSLEVLSARVLLPTQPRSDDDEYKNVEIKREKANAFLFFSFLYVYVCVCVLVCVRVEACFKESQMGYREKVQRLKSGNTKPTKGIR